MEIQGHLPAQHWSEGCYANPSRSVWKCTKRGPVLWHYVKHLLLWICEIHFFSKKQSLQLPKPDHYLPVSHHVMHFSYLYFISISLTLQVFFLVTEQRLYYCPSHTTTHHPPSFSGWMLPTVAFCLSKSKKFLGFDRRFCISSMIGTDMLQQCMEASAETDRLIRDTKGLLIECNNQMTSFHLWYSCLKSHRRAMDMRAELYLQLFSCIDLSCVPGQVPWLVAACSCISVSRIMPHWKQKKGKQ